MKSALQWTQEICSDLHGVILKPHEITNLVLAVQSDTAAWAAAGFREQPFAVAMNAVELFAEQALDASRDPT